MADDGMDMTQDCIEWKEDEPQVDLRNQINIHTPAHGSRSTKESPNQEIEELWRLLGKDKEPSSSSNSNLQRAHSYPMQRHAINRRHHQRISKRPRGARKRKRPASANGPSDQSSEQEQESYENSLGFEDLLKQLDTPPKTKENVPPPDAQQQHNTPTVVGTMPQKPAAPSALPSAVPPTLLQPPVAKPYMQTVSRQLNKTWVKPAAVNPSAPAAPNRSTTTQPVAIRTSRPALATVAAAASRQSQPSNTTTGSEFDDDDFDFSEADFAVLDAVVSSSQKSQDPTPPAAVPAAPTRYNKAPAKMMNPPLPTATPVVDQRAQQQAPGTTKSHASYPAAVPAPTRYNAAPTRMMNPPPVVQHASVPTARKPLVDQRTAQPQALVTTKSNASYPVPRQQPPVVTTKSNASHPVPRQQPSTVVPKPAQVPVQPPSVVSKDDEFGEFDFDFGDLDAQIQERISSTQNKNPPKPPRESFGDPFGDNFDFGELDKKIEERAPSLSQKSSILKPSQPQFCVSMATLQIPAPELQVRNKTVATYDPQRSFVAFSRYQVIVVHDDIHSYTKAVMVKSWTSDMNGDNTSRSALHRPASSQKSPSSLVPEEDSLGEGWIFLRGEWYHTPVGPKDAIHLCSLSGKYETNLEALPVVLNTNPPRGSDADDDLILVLHPDTLVPPTIVSETVSCSRRAVLRSRLGSTGISSKAALYGTMRHLLFEKCMTHQDFSIKFAQESVIAIVRQTAENLVALGIKEAEAKREVISVLPQLQQFRNKYITTGKDNGTLDKAFKMEGNGINPDLKVVTRSVEGTEESFVSPEFGLKGNIDVTISATTQDVSSPFVTNPAGEETSLIGIELKTGHNQKPQNAHMAQLALYTLMLSVRYGKTSPHGQHASKTGMLLYLNNQGMRAVRVSPMTQELKSLVGQRNVVASEMRRVSAPRGIQIVYEASEKEKVKPTVEIGPAPAAALPEVLSAAHACNRCFGNRECMLYAKADLATKPVGHQLNSSHGKLLDHFTGKLEPEELRYFLDWDRLIDLEADATAKSISQTWLTPSLELEIANGRTISSLVLNEGISSTSQDDDGSEWVPVTLYRSLDSVSKTELSRLSVEARSLVVISADSTSLASTSEERRRRKSGIIRASMNIARGSVLSVDDENIVVKVTRQERKQIIREQEAARIQRKTLKLRLDKDDVQTGLGTTRQNLVNLLTGDVPPFQNSQADPKLSQNNFVRNRYSWLRNAIIRLQPPQYDMRKSDSMFDQTNPIKVPGCDLKELEKEYQVLNDDQKDAVKTVFSANDYSLIQGLPGTGKSSTIAFVARLLAAHGKRVLITSYTHGAVDNLMMKLIEKGVSSTVKTNRNPRMIRVGRKGVSHPAVEPILLSEVASSFQKVVDRKNPTSDLPSSDAIRIVMSNARIVGVTALSIPRSPVLVGQYFDVVIVDEAGQISQPAILGALMASDTFVLVGDHKQLPPLVTSEAAEKAGFGVSMLSRLAEKHPSCIAQLTLQYRMHEEICQICNDIVYSGKLKCANERVRTQLLQLERFQPSGWVSRIINPKRPVVFANTDFYDRDTSQSSCKQLVGLERQPEKRGHGNMTNDREVIIVRRIIQELLESGLSPSSIGVISPFRAQSRKFSESPSMAEWKAAGLEISTIDRFQGRDKQVIILSFVRSNSNGFSGRLLNDYRRLNVAVSRAMHKLIMVGSYSTLHTGSKVLKPVLDGLTARNQVELIPELVLRSQISS